MLELLYWLTSIFSIGHNTINNEEFKNKGRINAENKEFKLYYDRKGRKFWEGEQVFYGYTKDSKHHYVLEKKDGTIVWDFTQKEIDKKNNIINDSNQKIMEKAINNNMKYYYKQIGKRNYKVEIETNKVINCVSYNVGSMFKYFKYYCEIDKNGNTIRGEKVEICREEYYDLGANRNEF